MERIYRKLTSSKPRQRKVQPKTRTEASSASEIGYICTTEPDVNKSFVPHPWRKKRIRMQGLSKNSSKSINSLSQASLSTNKTTFSQPRRNYATHHNMPIQSKIIGGMGHKLKGEMSPRTGFASQSLAKPLESFSVSQSSFTKLYKRRCADQRGPIKADMVSSVTTHGGSSLHEYLSPTKMGNNSMYKFQGAQRSHQSHNSMNSHSARIKSKNKPPKYHKKTQNENTNKDAESLNAHRRKIRTKRTYSARNKPQSSCYYASGSSVAKTPSNFRNFNVDDLKQCADPEETDGHDFTFSTEKQPLDDSYSNQIAGSYGSALKRIPLSSSEKKQMKNSHSSPSLAGSSTKQKTRQIKEYKEVPAQKCCKELDYNQIQLEGELSMIKLNESEALNNDIFKPIHYDISNKENIRSQNIREQGIQGKCLNEEDLDDTFSSCGSLCDVNDSALCEMKDTSIKSKGIKDLFIQNSVKAKPIVFVSKPKKKKITFACHCNSEEEFKNHQKFQELRSNLPSPSGTEEACLSLPLNCCNRALKWIEPIYTSQMKSMYEGIKDSPTDGLEHSIIQIKRDINRTYPNQDFFKKDTEGYMMLESLLTSYCKYDRSIGYVQGMNFIMGSLLYHCPDPHVAFWLFVTLMEQYQLCDNFKGDLKGIEKHCGAIKIIIANELPKLNGHFDKNEITIEMFATDWIFGVFSHVIHLDFMGAFYDNFLKERWYFFYKMVVIFLKDIQISLLQEEEMCDVLYTLKTLATPVRSDHSPAPSKRSCQQTQSKSSKACSEVSSDDLYHSPGKSKGLSFATIDMGVWRSVKEIFKKKQYECDWNVIIKRAETYKLKNPQAVKKFCMDYDLTH
ncbi:unnamed protein product [Moneuplotes crassus]|uniref:Rab-GAP TBC domain-containing protein n=2 Tax=Euplotes crassus TaxID=5936 RepID=A0AAD1Y0W9_EUPCR|nr:unnamed protein product [Moneuplotes crassus]